MVDHSHETERRLLLGREAMTNLDGMLKSRDITLPTKVHLAKAMVFPVVMYGCESWTIKKAEHRRIDAFELEKTLESPLDCKEIKPVNPKGNQSWIFIGETDAEAEGPTSWPPDVRNWLTWEDPERRSQAGGGLGRGDHFLSYKFIKRITERRANFTEQLLIASWGHQVPRKATHCLRKEVGQNIKDKKRDKRGKDGDPFQEGSLALAGLGEVFEPRRATWLGGEQ